MLRIVLLPAYQPEVRAEFLNGTLYIIRGDERYNATGKKIGTDSRP